MNRSRRLSRALSALALISLAVALPRAGMAGLGTATLVRADRFWVGWADTSHHMYRLAVWHPGVGDQFDGTRVIVRRESWDDPADVLVENVHVPRGAFRIESMQDGFTMEFDAVLPETGRWHVRIRAHEPARARVTRIDNFVVVASDAVLVGSESSLDGSQVAGGDGAGFVGGAWGWDGTGVARFFDPFDSVPIA